VKVAGRVLASLALVAVAALNAFVLAVIGALACDEGCSLYLGEGTKPGVPWGSTADAWQWDALLWLGVAAGLLALAGAVTLHVAPARRRAVPLLLASLAIVTGLVPWLMLLS
jgi:hypothetical protein